MKEKLLVIQSVRVPETEEIVGTKMFITDDQEYLKYKAKPNVPFAYVSPKTNQDTGLKVYYKIRPLGFNKTVIAQTRRTISRFNRLR